jgi:hypothetical protein
VCVAASTPLNPACHGVLRTREYREENPQLSITAHRTLLYCVRATHDPVAKMHSAARVHALMVQVVVVVVVCAASGAFAAVTQGSRVCPTHVGTWNGSTPPALNNLIADVPLTGNGRMGVLVTNQPWVWAGNSGTAGPAGGDGDAAVHFYIGSNTLWSVQPATTPVLGPTGKATRVALGGVSLHLHGGGGGGGGSGTGTSRSASPKPQWTFSAEQHIGTGVIVTTLSAEGVGVFTTSTVTHPDTDVAAINCSWRPAPGVTPTPLAPNVTMSAWTFRSTYLPGHGSPPGQSGPLVLPTAAGSGNGPATVWVARSAVPASVRSAVPIAAGLGASVGGLPSSAMVGPVVTALPGAPSSSELALAQLDIAVANTGELPRLGCARNSRAIYHTCTLVVADLPCSSCPLSRHISHSSSAASPCADYIHPLHQPPHHIKQRRRGV